MNKNSHLEKTLTKNLDFIIIGLGIVTLRTIYIQIIIIMIILLLLSKKIDPILFLVIDPHEVTDFARKQSRPYF